MKRLLMLTLSLGSIASIAATSLLAHGVPTRSSSDRSAVAQGARGAVSIRVRTTLTGLTERGTFSITGAISDEGTATGVVQGASPVLRLTNTLKGKKGTIVINVSAKFRDASGKAITAGWVVAHATGAYRGLTGTGTGNGHELTSKPALTHLNVFRGSVRTARVATSQSADAGLAAVRRATAKYIDPKRALADGYVPLSPCIGETGLGAMGMHYGKPSLLESRSIDPLQPELLLYVPLGKTVRLVGVEYWRADADQDLTTDDDRPSLFGQPFDGPMEGHDPQMPRHYDLHVWLWQANPAGIFAPFNPNVRCPNA